MKNPNPTRYDTAIMIRTSDDWLSRVRAEAANQEKTVSAFVRESVRQNLIRIEQKSV